MKLEIITVYEYLDDYIKALERPDADAEALWQVYAIKPFWKKLCQQAPMDITHRQPKPVSDIGILKKQVELLRRLDTDKLKSDFAKIASVLAGDGGEMCTGLYPIDNYWVRKAQNGVSGTSTLGHMVISIDPLADDYERWIPYVFGHEYYHNIYGRYWYDLRGGLGDMFVNALLLDGLADTFALSQYPALKPKWLFDISGESERNLWKKHYSLLIERTDVDYNKYMIGDDIDIPWCAGYAIGFRIVQQFLKSHPQATMQELLEMRPIDIFKQSGYSKLMTRKNETL